jgi:hypothetical protein
MLELAALAPDGSVCSATPDIRQALQLEPCIFAQSSHAPSPAEHPGQTSDGCSDVWAAHAAPPGACASLGHLTEELLNVGGRFSPSPKNQAANLAIRQQLAHDRAVSAWSYACIALVQSSGFGDVFVVKPPGPAAYSSAACLRIG